MAGIFFMTPLSVSASSGSSWDYADGTFPEVQLLADVMLSSYQTQTPERFMGFHPTSAESWIVTPHTPTTTVAGITIPTRRDNAVFVRTNYVKFSLQVNNGGSGRPQARATAVGAIYDLTPEADFAMREPLRQLELAVYAEEDGTVVATHRSFQFDGGADIDEDAVRERLLGETYALSERTQGSLGVTAFAYDEMPTDRDFRIDPATGKVQPVG